jgi:hypothetical protein
MGDIYMNRLFSAAFWTPVIGLLRLCRPTNIARLIMSIVVGIPIERESWRALAHVFKERFKTILPFIAHGYSAATIILKCVIVRIKTALFSVRPRAIFRCFWVGASVSGRPLAREFAQKTTAAFVLTRSQIASLYNLLRSAVTTAKPAWRFGVCITRQDNPAMKTLAGKIGIVAATLMTAASQAAFHAYSGYLFLQAAVALTKPLSMTRIFENNQTSETFSSDIYKSHVINFNDNFEVRQ